MRTVLFLFIFQIGLSVYAQDRCATSNYIEAQKSFSFFEAKEIANADNFSQRVSSAFGSDVSTVIKIPVVVHVLYKDASYNISDEQIKNQIEFLNRDFRRTNKDTSNTPQRFRSVAADMQIEFQLATVDPKGRGTNGIVRKQTNIPNFISNDKIKFSAQGGDDVWDSKSYLNIWVGNMIAGSGYSSVPGSDASKDGVVISTGAFKNESRIATHEIGHWLGLKHIWGDEKCGDDQVGDTPPQSTYTQGCPSGFSSSCTNGELGDMYMNYMDYTADACMNLFTAGQKKKALAAFANGGSRASLLQSKGLGTPWVQGSSSESASSHFTLYPNPARQEVTLISNADWIGKTISIMNSNGVLVQTVSVRTVKQKLELSLLKTGVYFIRIDGVTEKFMKL